MAKVTPNVAGLTVAGVINKRIAINPTKSVIGQVSNFAGFDPSYTPGNTQKIMPAQKYSDRNAQSGHIVFTNESKRPGTDQMNQAFYAHIA